MIETWAYSVRVSNNAMINNITRFSYLIDNVQFRPYPDYQNKDFVEMYRNGEWGLIGQNNIRGGDFICQQLGYKQASEVDIPLFTSVITPVTHKFCFDLYGCTGGEMSIDQCISSGYTTNINPTYGWCPYYEMTLGCEGTIRLL